MLLEKILTNVSASFRIRHWLSRSIDAALNRISASPGTRWHRSEGNQSTPPCAHANVRVEKVRVYARARTCVRGTNTAGAPRSGTQYCGSINLNKVNFCRGASEYGNFVFRRLGRARPGGAFAPWIQIKYIFYIVTLSPRAAQRWLARLPFSARVSHPEESDKIRRVHL